MMFYDVCTENQRESWMEINDDFDMDGQLHISINQMIDGHPNRAFKEQCVYFTKEQVIGLISHLSYALNNHVNKS